MLVWEGRLPARNNAVYLNAVYALIRLTLRLVASIFNTLTIEEKTCLNNQWTIIK